MRVDSEGMTYIDTLIENTKATPDTTPGRVSGSMIGVASPSIERPLSPRLS